MKSKMNYKVLWAIIIAVSFLLIVAIGTPLAIQKKQAYMKENEEVEITVPPLTESVEEIEDIPETEETTVPPTTVETEPPEPTYPKREGYKEVDEEVWARQDVNVRAGPGTEFDKLGILGKHKMVKRIGIGEDKWSMIIYEGQVAYVSSNYFLTEDPNK